jgi:hypothetical protein
MLNSIIKDQYFIIVGQSFGMLWRIFPYSLNHFRHALHCSSQQPSDSLIPRDALHLQHIVGCQPNGTETGALDKGDRICHSVWCFCTFEGRL